jgi:hypothetical protein
MHVDPAIQDIYLADAGNKLIRKISGGYLYTHTGTDPYEYSFKRPTIMANNPFSPGNMFNSFFILF